MTQLLKNKEFLRATAVLVGGMVGVGVFGIPFSFAKAGFWIGFLFLGLIGSATYLLDIIYGEIILRTHQSHQLVGYTNFYLGSFWKRVMFFSVILTSYSSLLAYIIVAGDFLTNIFSSVFYSSSNIFSIWFFVVASLLILFGIKTISRVEFVLSIAFIVVIGLIFGFGVGGIDWSNYKTFNYEFWFFPYGVILFAFTGFAAIPVQREVLNGKENLLKKSILTAVVLVGLLYFIFGFTVFGISGEATSPDAISGLVDVLGGKIIFLGSLFGVIALTTSYIMLGTALLEVFNFDYGLNRKISWLLTIVPPFVLFLGGLRNFIDVIGLAGGVAVGLEVIVLIFVFMKTKGHGDRIPEYSLKISAWVLYLLILVFAGGIGYTLLTR